MVVFFAIAAGDDGAGGGGGGSVCSPLAPLSNVPQASVAGHGLARGLVSVLQLAESQVTAPGFPDLPAATPHFLAHPVGSRRTQLPNSVVVE